MKKAGRIVLPDPALSRAHYTAYAFIMRFYVRVSNTRIILAIINISKSALFCLPVRSTRYESPHISELFRAQERDHSQQQPDHSPAEELNEEAQDT